MSTNLIVETTGKGNLPLLKISSPKSTAEIYLHGAHITHFQKKGELPLLFLSPQSKFGEGEAIRGGIPICFPWFGGREGQPSHGLARILSWELVEPTSLPDSGVKVHLRLPQKSLKPEWSALKTEFVVTVADTLTMELSATNTSTDKTLEIEDCLHTYFLVADIGAVSITGLQGASYLDNSGEGNGERKTDSDAVLKITKETNRLYLNTTSVVEIRDEKIQRKIRIEKWNSKSTVVWNPWTTQKMPDDFNSANHKDMVCVESGNIKENKISLAPGQTLNLKVVISSAPLK
ncbi:MAG TPA: D-hexose-6-phosphate mutarotase [Candidatus Acidoferrales bacterium]|jgi:glucose-6-phosphate 1-epimerase|nr:D-hexose-6-phosphate mutarotase [Candidatus Acidoferrales bacterium]